MSDLSTCLPQLDLRPYSHLIHSLQKHDFTVADLISVEPSEIARKCPLPLLDVRRLVADVVRCLQMDLNMLPGRPSSSSELLAPPSDAKSKKQSSPDVGFVKTLDPMIDEVLGGGFPTGYVSEVVGESAFGKTQLLYGLLLSVQLEAPQGLGKSSLYLSTEDALNPVRLAQILDSHPLYADLPIASKPSMDNVLTRTINDLESQQYLLEDILPIIIEARNVGLVIIDSVTANFRGERDTGTVTGLVNRATELNRLGTCLHRIANEKNIAVVVANQVSDRFAESLLQPTSDIMRSSSPSTPSTQSTQSVQRTERMAKMTLDHQQRFFTGWGDKPNDHLQAVKTPALGLVWSTQIDARIACKIAEGNEPKRRRIINVVFSPWTDSKLRPVEYTIESQGLVAKEVAKEQNELDELLDEHLWQLAEDDEFP